MKIKIVSIRKTNDKHILTLEREYLKRFKQYASVELVDIKYNESRSDKEILLQMRKHIKSHEVVVLLDEKGVQYSSLDLMKLLKQKIHTGTAALTFVIGGPSGFPKGSEQLSNDRLSLSKLTLPHKLTRLVLIEALYRSFDMLKGGNYHK